MEDSEFQVPQLLTFKYFKQNTRRVGCLFLTHQQADT